MKNEGHLNVRVDLLPQQRAKPKSPYEARKREVIFKRNVSLFYNAIYAAMSGGEQGPHFKVDTEQLIDGLKINFHPDITKKMKTGITYTETKVCSARSLRYFCAMDQVANYCYELLRRQDKGDLRPSVDYAFFRYGKFEDGKLGRLRNWNLQKKLCDRTRFGVVIPLNMFLFMLFSATKKSIDQTSSDSSINVQRYFELNGGALFTRLSKGDLKTLGELEGEVQDRFAPGFLESKEFFLKELEVEHYKSPMMKVNGHKIKRFPMTRYYLPNGQQESWLRHFFEHHERILGITGIEDYWSIATKEGCSD